MLCGKLGMSDTTVEPPTRLEAIVWCPDCMEEKFRVFSVEREGKPGHWQNRREFPDGKAIEDTKQCICGCVLERKP